MTAAELALVNAIRDYQQAHGGVSPTYAELRVTLGVASNGQIADRLGSLRKQGIVDWRPDIPRSIVLVADAISPVALNAASTPALRNALAQIAGLLAARDGGYMAATTLRRVADALLETPRRA